MSSILSANAFESAYSWYQRALLANAATSALRLRHRILQPGQQFRFSQETLQVILAEDSLHYLIFSLMFIMLPPVTGKNQLGHLTLNLASGLLTIIFQSPSYQFSASHSFIALVSPTPF